MAATDAPTKSPVLRPTPAPIDPTSVPIAPVPVPTPEPVDPTTAAALWAPMTPNNNVTTLILNVGCHRGPKSG